MQTGAFLAAGSRWRCGVAVNEACMLQYVATIVPGGTAQSKASEQDLGVADCGKESLNQRFKMTQRVLAALQTVMLGTVTCNGLTWPVSMHTEHRNETGHRPLHNGYSLQQPLLACWLACCRGRPLPTRLLAVRTLL